MDLAPSSPNIPLTHASDRLQRALKALQEAAQAPQDSARLCRDATIRRFAFTVELFWKLLKHILYATGRDVSLPRQILQEAYRAGLLDDEAVWLAMLKSRNLTSHTYQEALAADVYEAICYTYLPALWHAVEQLNTVHLPALGLGVSVSSIPGSPPPDSKR